MSRIFLSHSSADNAPAIALRDWLVAEGWNDLFLDLDPERGIAAGERWERALNEAASRCEAVLFLVSKAWLSSRWCMNELNLARRLNKRLFGVLTEEGIAVGDLPSDVTSTWQLVNLATGRDHKQFRVSLPITGEEVHVTFSHEGLARLRTGLQRAGLHASYFTWPPETDPNRAPYRGLRPLEADDAGIFFGREAPVIKAIDQLRGLREAAPPRLMVILGASGAGKSSFLRAGLYPRLARDDQAFLPLPVIRPERAALFGETGLLAALSGAFEAAKITTPRAELRAAIQGGAAKLKALLQALVDKAMPIALEGEAKPKTPTLVLSIDQGEELFLAEAQDEAQSFLALLRDLVISDAPAVIAVFTIRSDNYEQLQMAGALEGVRQETFSLPPMPKGSYAEVIKGPARRLDGTARAIRIDDALVDALLSDIEAGGAKDALPLLAFTLERLYGEFHAGGYLQLEHYNQLGRVKGSIEAAVEAALQAATDNPAIPRDRSARLALLRRGLIPWLAGIDPDSGAPRRRVARLSEIPTEARPLIELLVDQRLLSTDVDQNTGEKTIEPAHEALLRQWSLLKGWLNTDFEDLAAADGVKRAAREWDANKRDTAWLAHSGGRLEVAERVAVREDFGKLFAHSDLAYLAAARQAEQVRRAASRRLVRSSFLGLAATLILAAVAGAFGVYALHQRGEAEARKAQAEAATQVADIRNEVLLKQSQFLTLSASQATEHGNAATGLLLALEAMPDEKGDDNTAKTRPHWPPAEVSVAAALLALQERVILKGHTDFVFGVAVTPDGGRIVTSSRDKTARVWDAKTGAELFQLNGHTDVVYAVAVTPDGSRIVSGSKDKTARVWDAKTGAELFQLKGHTDLVYAVAVTPDGSRIVTGAWGIGPARVWDADTGKELFQLKGHTDDVNGVAVTPDGAHIVTGSDDTTARLWDGTARVRALFPAGQALVDEAKALVPRCLTPAERQSYFLAPVPSRWCSAMQKWPYDDVSVFIEGPRLLAEGKDAEATALFALALDRDRAVAKRIDKAWVDAYVGRGTNLLNESKDDEAEVLFAKAVARDPAADKRIDEARADAYFDRGSNLLDEGKDEEAEVVFAKALERDRAVANRIDEVWVNVFIDRGTQLLNRGRDADAAAVFAKALDRDRAADKRVDEAWAKSYDSRAWQRFLKDKAADGLADAEKAVALAPKDGNILDTRGQIYLALNRIDEALADFDRAVAVGFNNPGTYYGRGRCHEIKGNKDIAVADYRQALKLAKNSSDQYTKRVMTEAAKRLAALTGVADPPPGVPAEKQ